MARLVRYWQTLRAGESVADVLDEMNGYCPSRLLEWLCFEIRMRRKNYVIIFFRILPFILYNMWRSSMGKIFWVWTIFPDNFQSVNVNNILNITINYLCIYRQLRHKNRDRTPSWLISKTKMASALGSIEFLAYLNISIGDFPDVART